MSKKKKDKTKKVSVKKEKYLKFRKEKQGAIDVTMPELTDEQAMQKRLDEQRINSFLRYNRRVPERFIVERKAKSKR